MDDFICANPLKDINLARDPSGIYSSFVRLFQSSHGKNPKRLIVFIWEVLLMLATPLINSSPSVSNLVRTFTATRRPPSNFP